MMHPPLMIPPEEPFAAPSPALPAPSAAHTLGEPPATMVHATRDTILPESEHPSTPCDSPGAGWVTRHGWDVQPVRPTTRILAGPTPIVSRWRPVRIGQTVHSPAGRNPEPESRTPGRAGGLVGSGGFDPSAGARVPVTDDSRPYPADGGAAGVSMALRLKGRHPVIEAEWTPAGARVGRLLVGGATTDRIDPSSGLDTHTG